MVTHIPPLQCPAYNCMEIVQNYKLRIPFDRGRRHTHLRSSIVLLSYINVPNVMEPMLYKEFQAQKFFFLF